MKSKDQTDSLESSLKIQGCAPVFLGLEWEARDMLKA
jgi:hypothetical protein